MRNYTRWIETDGTEVPPGTMIPLEADILGSPCNRAIRRRPEGS